MTPTLRRRTSAAALVLVLPLVSACGLGFKYQTDVAYQAAAGSNDRTSDVDILNLVVVSKEDGSGRVVAALVNNRRSGEEKLTSISGDGVKVSSASVTIPALGSTNLADETPITVTGDAVKAGYTLPLSFTFDGADPVTLKAQVVNGDESIYDGIEVPSASSSSSPSSTSSSSPSASPSSGPSSSASPSAEPSASPAS